VRWLAVLAVLLTAPAAWAAPKAELWDRWLKHDAASTATVDHQAWQAFLIAYVKPGSDSVNRVAYGDVTPADRVRLGAYLNILQTTAVSGLNRAEQRAYWINLYNALTVSVILKHYPVESIRDIDISPGFFADGPWGAKLLRIEGEEVSLDDIEHRVLRPIWRDPRLHYAVNCASIGCPNLARKAYTAANSETLLDQAARAYINHPRGVSVTGAGLDVSSIYVWFEADFGGSDQGVIQHLRQFADPALQAKLKDIKRIDDDHYDWSLNDAAHQ
jgi:hypothetical protein